MDVAVKIAIGIAIQLLIGFAIGYYLHRVSKNYPVPVPEDDEKSSDKAGKKKLTIKAGSLDESHADRAAETAARQPEEVDSRSEIDRVPANSA
jgi:hypothetical protein